MRLIRILVLLIAALSVTWGCQSKEQSEEKTEAPEPEYITVQHILVGFQGSVRGKNITRSQESAAELAQKVYEMAKSGKDFGQLVQEFTDDAYPGIYKMANFGVPADMNQKIFARERMVRAFGDVGFPLAVGEDGMAEYDPQASPFGWHIIKRVE